MKELQNYSGDLINNLKLEDFSKDFLVKMLHSWSSAYMRMAECFATACKDVLKNDDLALQCELAGWWKITNSTPLKVAKALGIEVKDMVDVAKVFQLLPEGCGAGVYEVDYQIKDRNHVLVVITRCRTLDYLEKYAPERIKPVCHAVDIPINDGYAKALIPGGRMPPIKIPDGPRKDPKETACIWELVKDD